MKQLEAINISASSGLTCPNLYSNVMILRFTNAGKLCITKGPNQLECICVDNFYIPVNSWNSVVAILNPGETKRIDPGLIVDYGTRREIYKFTLSSFVADTDSTLDVSCVLRNISTSISFNTGATFDELITNLKTAINNDLSIKNEIEIYNVDANTLSFQIRALYAGFAFTYVLTLNTVVTGELQYSAIRYPNGRIKFLMIQPLYIENVNPVLGANNKHIQFAYDDDVQANGINATYRNIGKMFLTSSDDDVEETDMNLIETVWIKNTHTKALQVQVLVAI